MDTVRLLFCPEGSCSVLKAPSAGAYTELDPAPAALPRSAFLSMFLIGAGFNSQNGADGHHDLQVAHHVMAELVARDLCAVIVSEHQAGH